MFSTASSPPADDSLQPRSTYDVGQPGVQPVEDRRHEEERSDEPPGEQAAERQSKRSNVDADMRRLGARQQSHSIAEPGRDGGEDEQRRRASRRRACASGTATAAATAEPIVIPAV